MSGAVGGEPPTETLSREALTVLLADPVWAGYFEKCCHEGAAKLDAELGRFVNALRSGGVRHGREDVRLALGGLARERHPSGGSAVSPEGCTSSDEDSAAQSPAPLDSRAPLPPRPAPEHPEPEHPEDRQPDGSPAGAFAKISIAEESENARAALRALVEADPDAAAVYEKQCQQGLIGMATRARTLRITLEGRGEAHDQGAVEAAITESALDTHPSSPAAAWELLHAPEMVCREYAVNERDGPVEALVDAASKDEALFRTLTHLALDGDGPDEGHLLAVSREAYAALLRRGLRFNARGFSGHVWRALGEVLPDAPGVRWSDAWAADLARRALDYVAERPSVYPGGTASDEIDREHAEVVTAAEAEDRRRYRRALREWVAASLGASEKGC